MTKTIENIVQLHIFLDLVYTGFIGYVTQTKIDIIF